MPVCLRISNESQLCQDTVFTVYILEQALNTVDLAQQMLIPDFCLFYYYVNCNHGTGQFDF